MGKARYVMGVIVLALLLAAGMMGCPQKTKQGQAILLFSGGDGGKAFASALLKANTTLTVDDIQRFDVTISKIELQKSGGTADGESTEGEDIANGKVIFDSSMRVDLVQLQGLAALVTSKPLDAGVYTKIKITIADPEMVLKSALDLVIPAAEIQLTANNRLFVEQDFEVPAGKTSLVLFDMNGFEVEDQPTRPVEFKLLPHALEVGVRVESENVIFTGKITSIDAENNTIFVAGLDSNPVEVILPAEGEGEGEGEAAEEGEAMPAIADLSVGMTLEVEGTLDTEGVVTATAIIVIP